MEPVVGLFLIFTVLGLSLLATMGGDQPVRNPCHCCKGLKHG